jgi:hypothetical protein
MTAKALHHEDNLQRGMTTLLQFYENQGELYWCPVPNGVKIGGKDKLAIVRTVAKMKADGKIKPGAPDLMFVIRGRAVFIEIKPPPYRNLSGRLTIPKVERHQGEQHRRIRLAGGRLEVLTDVLQLQALLNEYGVGRPLRALRQQESKT